RRATSSRRELTGGRHELTGHELSSSLGCTGNAYGDGRDHDKKSRLHGRSPLENIRQFLISNREVLNNSPVGFQISICICGLHSNSPFRKLFEPSGSLELIGLTYA